MSREYTHDELREMLAIEALEPIVGEEGDALRAHVAQCASCQAMLAEYREAAAQLAFAAPAVPLASARKEQMRSRLVARAAAEGREDASPENVSPAETRQATRLVPDDNRITSGPPPRAEWKPVPRRFSGGGWLAAAASIVVLIGTLALYVSQRRDLAELRTQLADATLTQQALSAGLASRDSLINALTGAEVEIVQLASTGNRPPSGRMFWDHATNRWTLVGHHLGAPPTGRTYQLWLITTTSSAPIPAGTFAPDSTGHAVHTATYPLPREALVAIAVSEEPTGGSLQPTTQPFLIGSAKSE